MKVLFIIGTRPEAIKLAPVILRMKNDPYFKISICITAQHREMLDQVLKLFNIAPDFDLNLMTENQTLAELTARAIRCIDDVIKKDKPDLCIVQGDTTTAFAGALAAYYNSVKAAHVEAGLRTFNKFAPFPEETNRVLIAHIADIHFAPTEGARSNLKLENVGEKNIHVTGNTVIDALQMVHNKIQSKEVAPENIIISDLLHRREKFILVTTHRRENFGDGILSICSAVKKFAKKYPETNILFPVHLNPNVNIPIHKELHGISNIHLLGPLDYVSFVAVLGGCYIVLTDSGGVQEEAPAFKKPVLIMRSTTERPEAMQYGLSKLVGTDADKIYENLSLLMENAAVYESMTSDINPYGDGNASERIISVLKEMDA